MKTMNAVHIIGVDHGYGNILCKEIYNPDILQKAMHCSSFCEEMSGLLFILGRRASPSSHLYQHPKLELRQERS